MHDKFWFSFFPDEFDNSELFTDWFILSSDLLIVILNSVFWFVLLGGIGDIFPESFWE